MRKDNQPYGIKCAWDSGYLCKLCGELLFYDIETKEDHCFNIQCQNYPKGIEIYGTDEADLTLLYSQFADKEKGLGQIISTCDYQYLAQSLLERRRRIVHKFFTSGIMPIDDFLFSNEILLLIQKYKSLGIKKDLFTIKAIIQLYKMYSERLKMLEDLKEGRYLLAKKPINNKLFRLKYYDVIIDEIWSSYLLVNLPKIPDISEFHYHEVIQKLIKTRGEVIGEDFAPYFDHLWPLAISFQYLTKRNYSSALKYQYSVTPTDLANILSIIVSLKDNNLISIPLLNVFDHFISQPRRGKNITEFISMLSGGNDKIPVIFNTNGSIILDRQTLLLFFILMHSQHLPSDFIISGQQKIAQHKQEAGGNYEKFFKDKLENIGYCCLPTSTNIGGLDYDVIAFSELKQEILLIETKFKDPSPSSLSRNTLIEQELILEENGLLPQVIKHQARYDLLMREGALFQKTLRVKNNIKNYLVKVYFVTKHTPLISHYGNVQIISEKEFTELEFATPS